MIWVAVVSFGLAIGQGAILFRTSHVATGIVACFSCAQFLVIGVSAVRLMVGAA